MERKTLVIDTNVFLEFLLLQERKDECVKLMQAVERGSLEAYVTGFSLHSIEVLLHRYRKTTALEQFLQRVIAAQGLMVYQTSPAEELHIATLSKGLPLDFDDALQYYVTQTLEAVLVSFDKDFDRTDISRIEPSALLV